MKDLLESGVHFGHQTRRWNPKMKPYIYHERNNIYIIDLVKTIEYSKIAYEKIKTLAREGSKFLFVGTKKQASKAIEETAKKCEMFYVSHRWLGGMLTNFETVKNSIARLKRIERMEVDGTFESIVKKERVQLLKEKDKLNRNLAGIKEMEGLPDVMFIVDPVQEAIAVSEAKKLNIPIISIIDTNCDPDLIDIAVPGNDDAIRAINLFSNMVADAIIEGNNEAGKSDLAASVEEEAEEAPAVEEKKEEAKPEPKAEEKKEEKKEETTETPGIANKSAAAQAVEDAIKSEPEA